jgi:cytidylate kinase
MTERLAIVPIDAGSDVRGKYLDEPRIGTSSGKGKTAEAFRKVGYLANDSGRGYRTVAFAAAEEGVAAEDLVSSGLIDKWRRANVFGNHDIGLSFEGDVIDESELHGKRISNIVADFGALPEVRVLMKDMKMSWLNWAKDEREMEVVALDGREMRSMVQDMAINENRVPGAFILAGFTMIVNPVEAARRRMSAREEIKYDDPNWWLNSGVMETIGELRKRALKDEDRDVDPVGIPTYHKDLSEANVALVAERTWKIGDEILFDTTGISQDAVQDAGTYIVNKILETL